MSDSLDKNELKKEHELDIDLIELWIIVLEQKKILAGLVMYIVMNKISQI